jgi:disulfide bond formation protein DsbB
MLTESAMKKTTLYWILGGAAVAAVGGGVYLAMRSSSPQLPPGGGKTTPGFNPQANGMPPPTSDTQNKAPTPTPAVQTPQGYQNFLQDASNFVNTLTKTIGLSTQAISTIASLYNNLVNVVASTFQVSLPSLVPANFGLSNWPWA